MNTRIVAAAAALLIVALSGCTPVQHLDTPELRAEAVNEELTRVTEAVGAFDEPALRDLACEQTGIFEVPRTEDLPDGVEPPVPVVVASVEPLETSATASARAGESGLQPELHLASMQATDSTASGIWVPDVIVRVDDSGACLWAMGPPFVVLLGL